MSLWGGQVFVHSSSYCLSISVSFSCTPTSLQCNRLVFMWWCSGSLTEHPVIRHKADVLMSPSVVCVSVWLGCVSGPLENVLQDLVNHSQCKHLRVIASARSVKDGVVMQRTHPQRVCNNAKPQYWLCWHWKNCQDENFYDFAAQVLGTI